MLTFSKACSASALSNETADPDLLLLPLTVNFDMLAGITAADKVSYILIFSLTLTHFSVHACVNKVANL